MCIVSARARLRESYAREPRIGDGLIRRRSHSLRRDRAQLVWLWGDMALNELVTAMSAPRNGVKIPEKYRERLATYFVDELGVPHDGFPHMRCTFDADAGQLAGRELAWRPRRGAGRRG